MGNRLIFLYQFVRACTSAGTEKGSRGGDWMCRYKLVGGRHTNKGGAITLRGDVSSAPSGKGPVGDPMLPRKAAGEVYRLSVP